MFEKISYLKYKLLSELTKSEKRLLYIQKKKWFLRKITFKKYGILAESLQKIENYLEYQKNYVLFKQHWNITIPAEACGIGNHFSLETIKLKDIRRRWEGKDYPLTECSPYKFLQTRDERIYQKYIQKHIEKGIVSENCIWSPDSFLQLEKEILKNGYDPTSSIIVVDQNNIIIDGQHRSIILLYHHGGDYEIPVVRVSQRF